MAGKGKFYSHLCITFADKRMLLKTVRLSTGRRKVFST